VLSCDGYSGAQAQHDGGSRDTSARQNILVARVFVIKDWSTIVCSVPGLRGAFRGGRQCVGDLVCALTRSNERRVSSAKTGFEGGRIG
jgi:hypothetical protein